MRLHSTLTKSQQAARIHHFKRFRAECPEQPALAHWQAAMRHVFFIADLSARVKADKKRSKAARKGWATRRKAA